MKIFTSLIFVLLFSASASSGQENVDSQKFAENYFEAWAATQSPDASKDDIERYLSFLKDDVGHQHLPYDPDASRDPEGKENMREGMQYYLGAHTEYKANLKEAVPGYGVVVIKYDTYSKGKHPQTGQIIEQTFDTVEVLELEDRKVSVIRKYSD